MFKTHLLEQYTLPASLDRRCKCTQEKRSMILTLYKQGMSQRAISRTVKLDRNVVRYVIDPSYYEKLKQQRKERSIDGRYKVQKEKWKEVIREHRAYKAKALASHLHITLETRF